MNLLNYLKNKNIPFKIDGEKGFAHDASHLLFCGIGFGKPLLGCGGWGFEGSREKLVDRLAVLSSPRRTCSSFQSEDLFFVLSQTIIQRVERREKQGGLVRIWDP